jgi:hypothetical protein
MKDAPAGKQLAGFIAKYTPGVARVARAALGTMRKRLPGSVELVYENYNALAIAFSTTDRSSDIVLSIALYPRWVSLFLMNGPKLPDPYKLLKGGGTRVRHIVLQDAKSLDEPAVKALIDHALALATKPLDRKAPSRLVIKSISANQRPRRPAS